MRRRSTTATMAIRAASSPSMGWTQRIPASARSRASITSVGASRIGLDATASINTESREAPLSRRACSRLAATSRLGSSAIRATRSCGLNRETGPGRIARAFEQIRRSRSEGHPLNSTSRPGSDLGLTPADHNLPRRIKRPLTLSARSCITCTAMLVSRTSNADPRTSAATATAPAETAITSRMPTK